MVRANFVVFQNPGWDFPKAWVEFFKTLGGPIPWWDYPKAWVEFSTTRGGVFLPPPPSSISTLTVILSFMKFRVAFLVELQLSDNLTSY